MAAVLLEFLALFVATGRDHHIPAATVFRGKYFDEQRNLTYSFIVNTEVYDREVLFISGEGNRRNGPQYQRDQMRYYPRARLEVTRTRTVRCSTKIPGTLFRQFENI